MPERKLVIDQVKLTYEGIFDLNGLYRTIDGWFYEKGYDKHELKNYQQDLPTGKDIEIELRPWKKTTTYFKNIQRIRMKFADIKNIEVEKQGVKLKLQQGRVMMIFDVYLESDYEGKWDATSFLYFLRTVFDKTVFRHYFKKYERWAINDFHQLHGRIQQFLNVYRYEKTV